ncbi:MAG: type II secretion system protein [Cyanobacteria bacterium SIG30]|nr:type II secretion system protein [Cyanobacteria bacterium SIG30]
MSGGGATRSLKAFTLAEVLITLAIIGVVAALTIPTVVTNSRTKEIESRFKKSYAQLSQALQFAIKDYGSMSGWVNEPLSGREDACKFAQTYLIPYLKVAKDCTKSSSSDCDYERKNLRNDTIGDSTWCSYYLADGSYFALVPSGDYLLNVIIDANGHKKPNVLGYDILKYRIGTKVDAANKGLLDIQWTGFGSNSACDTGGNGADCSALIMKNGWKIPTEDDYVRLGGDKEKYPYKSLY